MPCLVFFLPLINFCIWFGGTDCSNSSFSFSSYWNGYPSGSFWLDLCCASKWTINLEVQQYCVHLRVMIILSLFFFFIIFLMERWGRGRDSHTNSVVDSNLNLLFFGVTFFLFTSLYQFLWSLIVVYYVKQMLLVIP